MKVDENQILKSIEILKKIGLIQDDFVYNQLC